VSRLPCTCTTDRRLCAWRMPRSRGSETMSSPYDFPSWRTMLGSGFKGSSWSMSACPTVRITVRPFASSS